MNAVTKIASSSAVALSMGAALLGSSTAASAAPLVPDHHAVVTQQHAPLAGGLCLPTFITSGCSTGGGTTGGTSTPELPSAALVGIGLIPPLLGGGVWRGGRPP